MNIADLVAKLDAQRTLLEKADGSDWPKHWCEDAEPCDACDWESDLAMVYPELRRIVVAAQAYVEAYGDLYAAPRADDAPMHWTARVARYKDAQDDLVVAVRGEA